MDAATPTAVSSDEADDVVRMLVLLCVKAIVRDEAAAGPATFDFRLPSLLRWLRLGVTRGTPALRTCGRLASCENHGASSGVPASSSGLACDSAPRVPSCNRDDSMLSSRSPLPASAPSIAMLSPRRQVPASSCCCCTPCPTSSSCL